MTATEADRSVVGAASHVVLSDISIAAWRIIDGSSRLASQGSSRHRRGATVRNGASKILPAAIGANACESTSSSCVDQSEQNRHATQTAWTKYS
jgi:hypothetical protein